METLEIYDQNSVTLSSDELHFVKLYQALGVPFMWLLLLCPTRIITSAVAAAGYKPFQIYIRMTVHLWIVNKGETN